MWAALKRIKLPTLVIMKSQGMISLCQHTAVHSFLERLGSGTKHSKKWVVSKIYFFSPSQIDPISRIFETKLISLVRGNLGIMRHVFSSDQNISSIYLVCLDSLIIEAKFIFRLHARCSLLSDSAPVLAPPPPPPSLDPLSCDFFLHSVDLSFCKVLLTTLALLGILSFLSVWGLSHWALKGTPMNCIPTYSEYNIMSSLSNKLDLECLWYLKYVYAFKI